MADRSADPQGHHASSPTRLPWAAWKQIGWRVWAKMGDDNIGLLAAGVAFYAFLSIVPLFGAVVMTYGLVADPANVARHMQTIIELVPADAARLIYQQLIDVTTAAAGRKGLGLLLALLLAIYGAMRASSAIVMALNVIYEQHERRSFIRTTLLALAITVGAVAIGITGLIGASLLALLKPIADWLGPVGAALTAILTWSIAAILASTAIAAAYRFAPDRSDARWRWLSFGSGLATFLWLVATVGFGFYASRFGDYNATYGSLGAVVVLLLWLWVSAYAILLGAEINAETERQTAVDTTTGHPRPMGQRGATVADMVAPD
ncbi:MAG: YihY/virulence factor BrkB family protein [Sphingomonas fennica]